MKRANRLDPMTKSPDPDDLSDPNPPRRGGAEEKHGGAAETRPNPDASEPHLPPPDDEK